jgi:large subunit ribosomal protein L13
MKTFSTRPVDFKRRQHVLDAEGQVLGRLATQAANLLQGKHKPVFARHLDTGDFVVITNAAKIRVTGTKLKAKLYYRHSGYPGGFKSVSLEKMMAAQPTRVIEKAVRGMLPHNRLGDRMIKKLKVYPAGFSAGAKSEGQE